MDHDTHTAPLTAEDRAILARQGRMPSALDCDLLTAYHESEFAADCMVDREISPDFRLAHAVRHAIERMHERGEPGDTWAVY